APMKPRSPLRWTYRNPRYASSTWRRRTNSPIRFRTIRIMDSLTFLQRAPKADPRPIYVLHGDEDFLKRQVLAALRERVLGGEGDAFGLSTYEGDKADFSRVRGDLETLPFLSTRRLIVIDKADPFVTRHRAALEKYVAQPASTGVLV